jgi:hypothetical protein
MTVDSCHLFDLFHCPQMAGTGLSLNAAESPARVLHRNNAIPMENVK